MIQPLALTVKSHSLFRLVNMEEESYHIEVASLNPCESVCCFFLKKWANPGLFIVYFRSFHTNNTMFQQIYVKNVNPVYGAGIRAHVLRNMSLFP